VAVSCSVAVAANEEEAALTVIEAKVTGAAVTVTLILPEIDPCVAVTVTEPAFTPVTTPEAPTDAIVESDVVQVNWEVRVAVVLSL
jgi:hypothetical protein